MNYLQAGIFNPKRMNKSAIATALLLASYTAIFAQNENQGESQMDTAMFRKTWYHLDTLHEAQGVATNEALEALSDQTSEEVIIAILDSGIDTAHADLKSQLWVNAGEIPGNGIDDDGNGYIDDVHGWNFLGGPNGNIDGETLELTRLYRQYTAELGNADMDSLKTANPELYKEYLQIQSAYKRQKGESAFEAMAVNQIRKRLIELDEKLIDVLGEGYTMAQVDSLADTDHKLAKDARTMFALAEDGLTLEEIDAYYEHIEGALNYHLNLDWDARDSIVGDDPNDWNDTIYGNTDIMGGDPDHGTHVAGIVGAIRNNDLGVDGIAPNVKLMILRVVPNGDERDKDVALAIRYAVRNGAKVINMSFGKDYSPDAELVQETARWAQEQDVLLIHAAGNDAKNLDNGENYPFMPYEVNNIENPAWIEVGASTRYEGARAANFSNYGMKSVDLFAPGEDIYSCLPPNTYGFNSGTSMAAPVVTGVAGLIRSYYPELTAAQVKTVLIESVYTPSENGDDSLSKMCITGGIVNAARAIAYIEAHKEELIQE